MDMHMPTHLHRLQKERKSTPGNSITYLTAALRAVAYNGSAPAGVAETYRKWSAHLSHKRDVDRKARQSWEELSSQSKWLHWKEVVEVVKEQRDEYERACSALARAREGLRYAVLLLYTCLPPGRSLEYRTLTFQRCECRELIPCVPTPADPTLNVLYTADDRRQGGLYLGAFKTVGSAGAQKISLGDAHGYFLAHIDRYIDRLRPRLLRLQPEEERKHAYLFVVRHRASVSAHTHTHTHTHTQSTHLLN